MSKKSNIFEITHQSSLARRSVFQTRKGPIHLPLFCPVATQSSVKSLDSLDLIQLEAQMILANAYHLHLRPGDKLIQKQGGLHSFMNWPRPILTDSGGYQVFSLSRMNSISDEGVSFRNHLDGDEIFMTPQSSIEIQWNLGADIIMAFDHCPLGQAPKEDIQTSVERTFQWLKKSHQSFLNLQNSNSIDEPPSLFGIVQGGVYEDLRKISLDQVESFNLPGIAVGGVSVGEDKEQKNDIIKWIGERLPQNKPRYLMGVGTPQDLIYAVDCGFDLFDCVLPTRYARSGIVFTQKGTIQIRNHQYKEDTSPLDEECSCWVCQKYTRSYIRHLFLSRELLSYRLNTYHNLYFYMELMKNIRQALEKGDWSLWKKHRLEQFQSHSRK